MSDSSLCTRPCSSSSASVRAHKTDNDAIRGTVGCEREHGPILPRMPKMKAIAGRWVKTPRGHYLCSSKGTALTCLLGVLRHVQRMIAREASTNTKVSEQPCRLARHACAREFEHKPPLCDTSPLAPLPTVNKKSLLPVPHQQDTNAFETGGERDEDRITGNKIWYSGLWGTTTQRFRSHKCCIRL